MTPDSMPSMPEQVAAATARALAKRAEMSGSGARQPCFFCSGMVQQLSGQDRMLAEAVVIWAG